MYEGNDGHMQKYLKLQVLFWLQRERSISNFQPVNSYMERFNILSSNEIQIEISNF